MFQGISNAKYYFPLVKNEGEKKKRQLKVKKKTGEISYCMKTWLKILRRISLI